MMVSRQSSDLISRAVFTHSLTWGMLMGALRTHQRDDELARAGTAPAVVLLALACVLAVRMADEAGAI